MLNDPLTFSGTSGDTLEFCNSYVLLEPHLLTQYYVQQYLCDLGTLEIFKDYTKLSPDFVDQLTDGLDQVQWGLVRAGIGHLRPLPPPQL